MSSVFIVLKRFLTSAFTENMGLKAVAAFFSILLFFLVMFQEESERIMDVEVIWNVPDQSSGLVLSSELPEQLRLRLSGPRSTIDALKTENIRSLNVDLFDRGEGTSHYYFAEEDFDIPPRTKFIRVTPEFALVKLERLVTRRLPIQARTYGKLEPGTETAGNPVVSPGTVNVVGPASAVRALSIIETEDVDIEGLGVGEHQFEVPARRVEGEGISIKKGDEIQITLKVRWIPGQKLLSGLLLTSRETELFTEFQPKEVAVSLSGPKVALDKLDPSKIIPVVVVPDEHKNRIGVFTGEVTLEGLPDNVFATSVAPSKVQVKLTAGGTNPKKRPNSQQ